MKGHRHNFYGQNLDAKKAPKVKF